MRVHSPGGSLKKFLEIHEITRHLRAVGSSRWLPSPAGAWRLGKSAGNSY
ncbi:hypothetical protein D3OALGA1CA_4286 [Olavius algarvensis associated proteobacterium Delta 3]|nr:hypothetical protein D3OALGB2SA_95 [Olavius algarvensis associated proteobacterium Delta 3]CAB5148530.1 hypothetical protein D3OALGA1CA_4286 [Olavius algarvensis associated proteobacterium Delta 3]